MISCVIFRDTSGIKLTCNGANCIHSEVSQPAWCSKVWVRYSISQANNKKQSSWNRTYFFYYQLPAAWVVHRKQWNKTKGKNWAVPGFLFFSSGQQSPLKTGKVGTKPCPFFSPLHSVMLCSFSHVWDPAGILVVPGPGLWVEVAGEPISNNAESL